MIEKVLKKVDEFKQDNKTYKEYMRVFCSSEKVKEIYKDDDEFKALDSYINENEKKEEEY